MDDQLLGTYQQMLGALGFEPLDDEVVALQREFLPPLIDEERKAFIEGEYGRLQSVLGSVYHEEGEARVFHPLPESTEDDGRPHGDPFELTLQELVLLPHLMRTIPRLGTLSYMPLFQMLPEDEERLVALSDVTDQLAIGLPIPDEKVRWLLEGHAPFIARKTDEDVRIIT